MINTVPFIINNLNNLNKYESKCSDNQSNKSDIAPYTPMYMADPQAFTEQLFKKLGYDKIPDHIQKNLDKYIRRLKMKDNDNSWCLTDDEINELIKKCLDPKIETMDNDISRQIIESVDIVVKQIKELHKHIYKQTTIKIPFKWPLVPISIYKDKFSNLGRKQMFQMAMTDEEFYWYETGVVHEGGELADDAALLLLRTLIELKGYCLAIAGEVGYRYDQMEEKEKEPESPGEKDKQQIKEWLCELKSIVCHIQMNSSNDEIGVALKKGWINHQNHLINKLVIYQECPPNTKCWYVGYGPSPSHVQCCECWRKNINNIVETEIKEID